MKRILLNLLHPLLPVLLAVYGVAEYRVLQYAQANAAFYEMDFFRLAAGIAFGLLLYGCAAGKARPLWPAVSLVLLVGTGVLYFIIPAVFRLFPMLLLGISLAIEGFTLGKALITRRSS